MKRQKEFQRNARLEELLQELNTMLAPVEAEKIKAFGQPRFPVILLLGCARSGTTLFLQWLASCGSFAYPSNLLSRFYGCPYIGARIQQLILDPKYNFNDELADFNLNRDFSSNLGKTRGILAVNEFWYFWRRFFSFGDIQYLEPALQARVDGAAFASEIAALEAAFEKPFAMKAMIVNWNIPLVDGFLDKVLFIHIKRDIVNNAQSLLESRERYFGDRASWYSFKPPEYPALKALSPLEQVAGQVYCTNRAVEQGLREVRPERFLTLDYDDFCSDPRAAFELIKEKFALQGCAVDWQYPGPERFKPAREIRLTAREIERVEEAYRSFKEGGVGS